MSTDRITVAQVIEAYIETGVVPEPLSYKHCPGGVLARVSGVAERYPVGTWFGEVFGGPYRYGFICGFDSADDKDRAGRSLRFREGFADGKAAREAVARWIEAGEPITREDITTQALAEEMVRA